MGALDVCPFIPISGVTEEECVQVSKNFGERLGKELSVPVFLYGAASTRNYRKTMPQIRAGEYEGLEEKLKDERWAPDFGPATFVPRWGGTVTGVRKFLIAYNVNLLSTKEQAHSIAVTGSELVGLVPLNSILEAAEFYMEKENLMVLDEDQKVHLAINRLGLATLSPFNPKERIIEYCLPDSNTDLLVHKTVCDFVTSVGDRSPAPGGGSVSALLAALGCGLGAMVSKLSYGKRQWEHLDSRMRVIIPRLHRAMLDILPLIDADTEAFNDYMAALKLPKNTDAEVKIREEAMQDGLKTAIGVPMSLAQRCNLIWGSLLDLAECGNLNCKSDLQVAVRCLETAVHD